MIDQVGERRDQVRDEIDVGKTAGEGAHQDALRGAGLAAAFFARGRRTRQ